jgi:hypothetical protein
MATRSKQQMDAAGEFANATIAALKVGEGVHPPTVIAASARMAGLYLFRSFGFDAADVAPGKIVLSTEANEQAPLLMQITAGVLARVGIKIPDSPPGRPEDPTTKPPLELLDTQKKVEPGYAPIKAKFAFSDEEASQSVAVATALLIRHCAKVLDPSIAFGIAVYGFIEGAKTVPERPAHE